MIVCVPCKKEMTCIHNGTTCRWNKGTHVYNGDEYVCKGCGAKIVYCNSSPMHDSNPQLGEHDYIMDGN